MNRPGFVATGMLAIALSAPLTAQERYTLQDVSFLSGCWAGQIGSLDMREQWTEAAGGVMLSTTRYLRGGAVVDWEFGRIVEDADGVTLWPYPKGVISEHGFPLVSTAREYVFENLAHEWAGMISISGSPSKTVPHYEPNSRHVPLYMVMGQLDGRRANGSIIDDYMSFKHDAMVVMYRGRGREYFYDEIHRLFEWMQLNSHPSAQVEPSP